MTADKNDLKIKNVLLTAMSDLVLADRRLYNYLLHNAFPQLGQQLNFSLALSELRGVFGAGLPPITRLKESLRRLMKTLIEFEIDSQQWVVIGLLEQAQLDEKNEQLQYGYSIYCRQLFLNPISLEKCLIQAHFNQKYSNLLYEILSEAYFSNQKTLKLEVSDLRDRLAIGEKKLSNFGDLNRFVLIPALSEINIYASFAIKMDTERKGMKVTHVIFQMIQKRDITHSTGIENIIPPKRPLFFIDNPSLESAYAYLLNAPTQERRKFFDQAIQAAAAAGIKIDEEIFDRPDLWFQWVEGPLLGRPR